MTQLVSRSPMPMRALSRREVLRRLARLDVSIDVSRRTGAHAVPRTGPPVELKAGRFSRAEQLTLLRQLQIPVQDFDDMR